MTQKLLKLAYLPDFAKFLKENFLHELASEILRLMSEFNVPIYQFFAAMPHEQKLEIARSTTSELLEHLAADKPGEYIDKSLANWQKNLLPTIAKADIVSDDIAVFNHVRKRAFFKFIPNYASDLKKSLLIAEEIDSFMAAVELNSFSIYLKMQEEKVSQQLHFIEKINDTIPAIVYLFDFNLRGTVFSNKRIPDELGYSPEDVSAMGNFIFEQLIHPDDLSLIIDHAGRMQALADGEVWQHEYRVRAKNGRYRWQRSYESVFRRDERGLIQQVIGISFDVEKEKQIALQLENQKQQLLQVQALTGMGSFEADLVRHTTEFTPELEKILALNDSNNLEEFMEKVHPSDRIKVRQQIEAALRGDGEYDAEFRHIVDGNEKILWSRGVIAFRGNVPVSMKGSVMDVTERHHMIQRLQRSEELYKQAQALAKLGNWTWDLRLNRIKLTEEVYRIFELNPDSEFASFDEIESLVHPEDKEMRRETLQKSIQNLEPYELYYRTFLKNGSIKFLHSKGEVMIDEKGVPYKMFGTIQDVTDQKEIEQKLLENQIFIQKIADATPSIIASYNINTGRYSFVSKGLHKLLGYDPEEARAQGISFFISLVHPDDLGPLTEKNTKALELANQQDANDEEIIVEFQYRMRHINGSYRWFHTYATIFDRNKSGMVEQVLNISIDITDRIEAEQKIYQKTIELQQSNASLEEFAHVASHDLKEPLRKISTFGDRLHAVQHESLNTEGKLYLKKIIDSSRRMQQLIDDLLTVSLISTQKTFVSYSLRQIVQEVLNSLEYKIEEKKARIFVDALPEAKIVPSQFRQLFQNLLSNSLKFVSDNIIPEITIRADILKPSQVSQYNLKSANDYVEIKISDNGIGFEETFSEQIFAIFQRLHSRSEYEGTGIGLAICKKIVENHGGVIFANAKENQGSVFTVIVPL